MFPAILYGLFELRLVGVLMVSKKILNDLRPILGARCKKLRRIQLLFQCITLFAML